MLGLIGDPILAPLFAPILRFDRRQPFALEEFRQLFDRGIAEIDVRGAGLPLI
jgi:hypothetical protein